MNYFVFKHDSTQMNRLHSLVPERHLINNLLTENEEWASRVADHYPVLTPPIDIVENEDSFTVKVELPGIDPSEITVEIGMESIEVQAHKRGWNDVPCDSLCNLERNFGTYVRSVALPTKIADNDVKSKYSDGILTLVLPKRSASTIRPIAVEFIN